MKYLLIGLVTLISSSAFSAEYLGTCVSEDYKHVILTKSGKFVDADLRSRGITPLTDSWDGRSVNLSSKATVASVTTGVLKGCLELAATKQDPSRTDKSPLWTMFVCPSGRTTFERGVFNAQQFQPTDYLLECPVGLLAKLKDFIK